MKNNFIAAAMSVCFLVCSQVSFGQRYLSEVFTDVVVTQDVLYSSNITVITGSPSLEDLYLDVYEPMGDTETNRPVVIVAHDGEYLPEQLNRLPFGTKSDSAVAHLCTKLAKRGFVAISYDYREGWNPTSSSQEVRLGTYINAHYRAVQDGFTVVRFLKNDASTQGNTFGIDTSRIVTGGIGTGGQVSLSMAFLDKYSEINLPKFINPMTMQSFIDTSLSADIYGMNTRPLNIGNHVFENNTIHMAFHLGGFVGDSSWIELSDIPVVSFASVTDPFSPYDFGASIMRITGDFYMNVSGAKGVQRRQNVYANNAPFANATFTDPYTTQANQLNEGLEGLYPFYRPGTEDSPWNWWDTTVWNIPHPQGGTFNDAGMQTNPDMSATKAQTYLDTVVNYLSPRIVCALQLPGCVTSSVSELSTFAALQVYPNPAKAAINIDVEGFDRAQLISQTGRVVASTLQPKMSLANVENGVYLLRVWLNDGSVHVKRVVRTE